MILIRSVQPRSLTCVIHGRFELLWESNAATDLTGGGGQVVIQVMGRSYKYGWSFTCSSATHLLLCGPIPNRPQVGDPWFKWHLAVSAISAFLKNKSWNLFTCSNVCVLRASCPTLLQPHGLKPPIPLSPWNFPGKNTGVGYHALLQGIFPT